MWNPPDKVAATREEMDEATQKDMIRKAAGENLPEEDIELITTGEWQLSGLVADTFSSGRVFIAGDAAHTLPPNRGGYGANTGIADAHNLAWKLASVLNGTSRPDLLRTYDAERRPAAKVRHDQMFVRDDYTRHIKGLEWAGRGTIILDDVAMELGQMYRSEGVVGGDEDVPAAKRPDEWNGQPGTRAPHVSLRRDGEAISSLDLFCHGWVLVSKDIAWEKPASLASEATGVDVAFVHVGEDADVQETDGGIVGESFGIGETGAILVRPDGYVAWRSSSNGDKEMKALGSVLGQVSFATKGN